MGKRDTDEIDTVDLNDKEVTKEVLWSSYILPLIAIAGYIFIVIILWKNIKRFQETYSRGAATFLTIVGGLIYGGLLFTWAMCLQSTYVAEMGGSLWVSFWFISTFTLLCAAAYMFFQKENATSTAFIMLFTWITALVTVFVSASCWPPGLIFTIVYLAAVTWLWAVVMRATYNSMNSENKMGFAYFYKKIFSGKNDEDKNETNNLNGVEAKVVSENEEVSEMETVPQDIFAPPTSNVLSPFARLRGLNDI